MIDPIRITIPNQRKVKAETSTPTAWLSAPLSSAPAHTLPVSTVAAAITRAPFLTVGVLRPPGPRRDGETRGPGGGCPRGEIGGERGQVAVRPRRERVPDPRIELVFGQPALHERVLEHLDRLLAVGMRGP